MQMNCFDRTKENFSWRNPRRRLAIHPKGGVNSIVLKRMEPHFLLVFSLHSSSPPGLQSSALHPSFQASLTSSSRSSFQSVSLVFFCFPVRILLCSFPQMSEMNLCWIIFIWVTSHQETFKSAKPPLTGKCLKKFDLNPNILQQLIL